MLRNERIANAALRNTRRRELQTMVLALGPRGVYCGLLAIQQRRNYSSKFALAVFKDLYGTWPRNRDKGPPEEAADMVLEEWLATRKKKPRRTRMAKSAPLIERMEKPTVNAAGFVEGTLMKEEDFNVEWQ